MDPNISIAGGWFPPIPFLKSNFKCEIFQKLPLSSFHHHHEVVLVATDPLVLPLLSCFPKFEEKSIEISLQKQLCFCHPKPSLIDHQTLLSHGYVFSCEHFSTFQVEIRKSVGNLFDFVLKLSQWSGNCKNSLVWW
jgi:hypothetical protein